MKAIYPKDLTFETFKTLFNDPVLMELVAKTGEELLEDTSLVVPADAEWIGPEHIAAAFQVLSMVFLFYLSFFYKKEDRESVFMEYVEFVSKGLDPADEALKRADRLNEKNSKSS